MTAQPDPENNRLHTKDIFAIQNISSINLSPDGNRITCVTTVPDLASNRRDDYITLIEEDKQVQLVTEGASPVWSPDGSQIAYEADEEGQSGIWIYQVKDRKKRFLTPLYHSAYFINHLTEKNFSWSPDGKYIAYLSTHPYSPGEDDEEKNIKVINRLLYKSKGGAGRPFFADDRLTHIWLIPAAGGHPQVITPGDYNEHSISWSPDSTSIAFISNHSDDPDNNQKWDLWTVNIRTKKLTRLTEGPGTAFLPQWSPSGKHIAYLAITGAISTNDSQSDDMHLYVKGVDGGSPQCLTACLDRRVEKIAWHPDGDSIFFTAGNQGAIPLYRVLLHSHEIETVITGKFQVTDFSVDITGEKIAYLKTDSKNPPEIFRYGKTEGKVMQVTRMNTALVDRFSFPEAEEFRFRTFDETEVQGWLLPPAGFKPERTYPLILMIHGGPHNMYGDSFDPSMQILSAHGYGVVFINPRGSSGYGQAFTNGNVLNWGGGDYRDLMGGLDYILKKFKWIDPERLGVMGQSYGGYMTNWIITQTHRFKAAVSDGGISNLISFAGTSLYHSLMESEFNGNVYDNYSLLWQWSPLRNVKNVTTPTLFLHGEKDNEVPVSQAEEMFIALKKLGVPTTFVQYLGEGHGWRPDLKPQSREDLYKRMLNWFGHYLGDERSA